MKPNIAIVGSAPLITDEINALWNELTAGVFPAEQLVTTDINALQTVTKSVNTIQTVNELVSSKPIVIGGINNTQDFDIYICAPSQRELLNHLPSHKVFSIELVPTAAFFLRIAGIPKGSTIHVFNNLMPYIRHLIAYCKQLGLMDYIYVPIAFDEQPQEIVSQLLGEAQYIIGVDRFIDAELTDGESIDDTESGIGTVGSDTELINRDTTISTGASVGRFASALNKDVTIIKATRTLALKDTSLVLAAIAEFYMSQPISQDEQTAVATQLTNITMQVLASQADLKASVGTELELNSAVNGGMTLGKIRELLGEMGR